MTHGGGGTTKVRGLDLNLRGKIIEKKVKELNFVGVHVM